MTRTWTPACTQGPVFWVVLCSWTESASVPPTGMRCYSYHHSLVISWRKQAWEEPRNSEVIPSIPCIPFRSCAENRFMQPCKFPSKSSDRQHKPGIIIWNPSRSHQTNNLDYCGGKKGLILFQVLTGFTRVPCCFPQPPPIHTLICTRRRQHSFEGMSGSVHGH